MAVGRCVDGEHAPVMLEPSRGVGGSQRAPEQGLVRRQHGSAEVGFDGGDRAHGAKAVATDDDGVGVGRCVPDDRAVQPLSR